jgi:hypothetical protein
MSVVTLIRDYVDILNTISQSFTAQTSFVEFIKETGFYLLKTIQFIFIYLMTFQWVRDFTLLPITIPNLTTSIIQEKFFLEDSSNVFLNFLEFISFKQNNFFVGFLNSLFLSFPISIVHILAIRRLYIKGIPAAVFSISGYLIGQILFITCVIFGIRWVLIPWLTLEPLNYFLGLVLLLQIVYKLCQENLQPFNSWKNSEYKNYFLTSFILSWCEQSSVLQYIGNLSFSPTTSIFEIPFQTTNFQVFLGHSFYIIGLLVGSIFFTILWGFLFLGIKIVCLRYTPLLTSKFIQSVNFGSLICAIGLSFSSIPFYGIDYLLTNPLGFVSNDRVFKNTILDQYYLKDSIKGLGLSSQYTSVDLEVSPFDRGRYLLYPEIPIPASYEDLNYRGETDWLSRFDKMSTISDSRAGFFSIAKIFQKNQPQNKSESLSQKELEIQYPLQTRFAQEDYVFDYDDIEKSPEEESRFEDWYGLNSRISEDPRFPIEAGYAELQDMSFPLDFLRLASVEPGNFDIKLKQKYYSNPVYKTLLSTDIDLFLNRQPKTFRLDSNQEVDLYTKRQMLMSYYDSLRDYEQLPYVEDFEDFFDGSKSFSTKVYNQQFKGTLRSLCRLFSLTYDKESTQTSNQLVLKYDQPLYVFNKKISFSPYHEELLERQHVENVLPREKQETSDPNRSNDMSVGPIYAGWNEKSRKFIITNKFLPRTKAGYEFYLKNKQKYLPPQKAPTNLVFTLWPLSKAGTDQSKSLSQIPFSRLYTSQADFGQMPSENGFGDLNISSLPGNWETRNRKGVPNKTFDNLFDYLAPQRGGFLWPGSSLINFQEKNS